MASYLTSTTLIESVKRRAHIPTSQVTFENSDFLAFANEEVEIGLVPSILQFHEEFLVYPNEIPLVANQSSYDIPSRAIGGKIRSIFFQDNNGNLREMAKILPEDRVYYQYQSNSSYPYAFYLQNNSIILVPEIQTNATGSLVVDVFQRPNQLVESDRIATITAIDTGTGVVTVTEVPSVFSSSTPLDLLQTNSGHKWLGIDITPTSVDSMAGTITFDTSDLPSSLSIGDTIALSGECFIPQVPDELHSVLAQRIACRCLESQGDLNGLQSANQKLMEMEQKMGNVIDNRTEGNPQKVNNLRSTLRMTKFSRRRNLQ